MNSNVNKTAFNIFILNPKKLIMIKKQKPPVPFMGYLRRVPSLSTNPSDTCRWRNSLWI